MKPYLTAGLAAAGLLTATLSTTAQDTDTSWHAIARNHADTANFNGWGNTREKAEEDAFNLCAKHDSKCMPVSSCLMRQRPDQTYDEILCKYGGEE